MENVDNRANAQVRAPEPHCPACGQAIGEVWVVTKPTVYVICGGGTCERWAAAQGLWAWTDSGRWRPAGTWAPTVRRTPVVDDVPATFLPSPQIIENCRSVRGGWSQATLAAWGVPWPPPKGWRQDLERRWREQH